MPFPRAGATDVAPGTNVSGIPQNAAPMAPGAGFAAQANQGALQQIMTLFLPEERPIPGATIFNTGNSKGTVAAEANILIPNAGIVIPQGSIARLDSVNFYVDNLLASSNISFTVLQNGAPIQGLTNVFIFPGVAARVAENFSLFVRITNGATLTVTYTNTDGGSYTVGASLSGWFWPESLGRLYQMQGQAI